MGYELLEDDPRDDVFSEGDPEAIVVYRNRRALIVQALSLAFLSGASSLAAVITFLPAWEGADPTNPLGSLLLYGIIAVALAGLAVAPIAQAIRNRPALIVNAHGIVDSCAGPKKRDRRLIRWDEIASIRAEVRGNRTFMLQSLNIEIYQDPVRAARVQAHAVSAPYVPASFATTFRRIYQDQLSMPVIELAYAIDLYIALASPPGWHGRRADERHEMVEAVVVPELPLA